MDGIMDRIMDRIMGEIMPNNIARPDFQLVVRKASPLSGNATTIAQLVACSLGGDLVGQLHDETRFWETATMLVDGTINLQFAGYNQNGEILEGFEMKKPSSSGYQEIVERHFALKPGETSFLQR